MTVLSQPQDTMSGLVAEGEKRTQLTHSVWPSSPPPMVYLQSPGEAHAQQGGGAEGRRQRARGWSAQCACCLGLHGVGERRRCIWTLKTLKHGHRDGSITDRGCSTT